MSSLSHSVSMYWVHCYVPRNILGFSEIMRSKDGYIVPIMETAVLRGRV